MGSSMNCPSLRSECHRRRGFPRLDTRLPRLGEERGVIADLAPPAGKALARKPVRAGRLPQLGSASRRGFSGARTLLTMSAIFSWFGL
jgi:hypothetical protein